MPEWFFSASLYPLPSNYIRSRVLNSVGCSLGACHTPSPRTYSVGYSFPANSAGLCAMCRSTKDTLTTHRFTTIAHLLCLVVRITTHYYTALLLLHQSGAGIGRCFSCGYSLPVLIVRLCAYPIQARQPRSLYGCISKTFTPKRVRPLDAIRVYCPARTIRAVCS